MDRIWGDEQDFDKDDRSLLSLSSLDLGAESSFLYGIPVKTLSGQKEDFAIKAEKSFSGPGQTVNASRMMALGVLVL